LASPFRVFVIFAIGIILPAGLLGYLGFKSFQYENIVLKNQSEQRYTAIADSIQKNANDFFLGLVDALHLLSESEAFQKWNSPLMINQVLRTSDIKGFPVKRLFVFDEQERMVVPYQSDGSATVGAATDGELDWGSFAGDIHRIERLEFVDKNNAEAIKGYEALKSKPLPDKLQTALLKNIASCYRKINDTRSAETAYIELIKRFDHYPDPVGYPDGILGRQLLAELYDATAQKEKALSVRLDLIEGILFSRWNVSSVQAEKIRKQVEDAIAGKMADAQAFGKEERERWSSLQSQKSRLESLRLSGKEFLKSEWPIAVKRLQSHGWLDKGGVLLSEINSKKKSVDIRGNELMVVSPVLDSSSHHRKGLMVAILDGPSVWKVLDSILMNQTQPAGLTFAWAQISVTSSWKPGLKRSLDVISPALTFTLFFPTADAQGDFLRHRMWTYGGMIGLSLLVIVIGLIVMLQAMKREKENADLKAEFVANVSHELRTPLTAISYIGERLNLGRFKSQEEVKEFYSMLGEETNHLRELIEDILDFSKMMGGKKVYRKEPTSLTEIIEEAHARFDVKARAQGFSVSLKLPSEPVTLMLDGKAIRQVVLNLLDNALKYSGDSREIVVGMNVSSKEVVLSVQDFGIGIPSQEKEKIFEKFYRVGQGMVRDTQGGVGLGLAMVKHIVEGHGGRVTFISADGKGSTFFLTFPREEQR